MSSDLLDLHERIARLKMWVDTLSDTAWCRRQGLVPDVEWETTEAMAAAVGGELHDLQAEVDALD